MLSASFLQHKLSWTILDRMNTEKSRKHAQQGAAGEEALRDVMAGVYCRHEFARRDADVVAASNELMTLFPMTNAARTEKTNFTLNEAGGTITDLMMTECSAAGNVGEKRRTALSDFLVKYEVMPVPPSLTDKIYPNAGTFLLYPWKLSVNAEERLPALRSITVQKEMLLLEYLKILKFESFVTSDLGLVRPAFMPLVPIDMNNATFARTFARCAKTVVNAQPARYSLVLIDHDQPVTTRRNHFEMQMSRAELFFANAKIKREQPAVHRVIPWSKLDGYLAILDWKRSNPEAQHSEIALTALEPFFTVADWEKEKKKRNHIEGNNDKFNAWAETTFTAWLRAATDWVRDYKIII